MCDGCGPKAALQDVIEALEADGAIGKISLLGQHFGDCGAEKLATALQGSITRGTCDIHSIYLMNNGISDTGAKALVAACKGNNTITSLNLNGNKIGSEGARAVADFVRIDSAIQNVYLINNPIGSEGIDALTSAKQDIPAVALYF